jgi:hypothetical protein
VVEIVEGGKLGDPVDESAGVVCDAEEEGDEKDYRSGAKRREMARDFNAVSGSQGLIRILRTSLSGHYSETPRSAEAAFLSPNATRAGTSGGFG